MENAKKIDLSKLEPSTFWDVKINTLQPEIDFKFIIHRIAHRGTDEENNYINSLYSYEEIASILIKFKGTEQKILNFYTTLANA